MYDMRGMRDVRDFLEILPVATSQSVACTAVVPPLIGCDGSIAASALCQWAMLLLHAGIACASMLQ